MSTFNIHINIPTCPFTLRIGPDLLEACKAVPPIAEHSTVRCPTGEARITPGAFGRLQVQHVIHTVGPIYSDDETSAPLLESAYRSSMTLATNHRLSSIAFPAISCGVYGYPLDSAAVIALRACREEAGTVEEVHFYLFGEKEVEAWRREADATLEVEEEQKEEEKEESDE